MTAPPGETALPAGDQAVARSVREGTSKVSVPLSAGVEVPSAAGLLVAVEPEAQDAAQELRATEPSSPAGQRAQDLGVAGFTDLERCGSRVRVAFTSAAPDDPPPSVVSAAVRSCAQGIDKLGDAYEGLTGEQLRVPVIDLPG